MAEDRFRFELLARNHDRRQFSCGVGSLDRYFQNLAGQDSRRHISAVHVIYDVGGSRIAGFYTLSASSISLDLLPALVLEGLPPYEVMPAYLLGRLAIDQQYRSQGLGSFLLADALRRSLSLSDQVGAMAVIVDAIDEHAQDFYRRHGFEPVIGRARRLLIPMRHLERRSQGGTL